MDCIILDILILHQAWTLLKLMSLYLIMPSNNFILGHRPFLLLPSILPRIRFFSNESVLCIRWPKHWGFSFRISPSNEYSGLISFQFSSVTQSCATLCNPMNLSTSGFPVRHQLLEFTQTDVHQVGDAIQPSHPLSYPSPPALNLS